MAPERKMISVRLPASLVTRLDYASRNSETEGVHNRSTAAYAAIVEWVQAQEARFRELGILSKKAG